MPVVTVSVSELPPLALNWVVARGLKYSVGFDGSKVFLQGVEDEPEFNPVENWEHAGPIIEKTGLSVTCRSVQNNVWLASDFKGSKTYYGLTPLDAMMRCFALSVFGSKVDVPKKLLAKKDLEIS